MLTAEDKKKIEDKKILSGFKQVADVLKDQSMDGVVDAINSLEKTIKTLDNPQDLTYIDKSIEAIYKRIAELQSSSKESDIINELKGVVNLSGTHNDRIAGLIKEIKETDHFQKVKEELTEIKQYLKLNMQAEWVFDVERNSNREILSIKAKRIK